MYFLLVFVDQQELEIFDGVSPGKYTIGLGQTRMAVVSDREDINSICLTVVHSLLEKTKISPMDVGFLMVGTESLIDEAKSVKSVLMQLFSEVNNNDIQGSDTRNACYGGTAALFHALDWVESSNWDGRLAIIVTADIALYEEGNARPTSGAAAIAMLIGPNAPLVFDRGLRATHMYHEFDFYKPILDSEYPICDGKLSINCYFETLEKCYDLFKKKYEAKFKNGSFSLNNFDGLLFHAPYCRIVRKSLAILILNECFKKSNFFQNSIASLESVKHLKLDEKFSNKEVENIFLRLSNSMYEKKTKNSLTLANEIGNMYTASVYSCLISYLLRKNRSDLKGNRLFVYSHGGGIAASIFSIQITDEADCKLNQLIDCIKTIPTCLANRTQMTPKQFNVLKVRNSTFIILKVREESLKAIPFTPKSDLRSHFPKTYVLCKIDEMHRRYYMRVE